MIHSEDNTTYVLDPDPCESATERVARKMWAAEASREGK